MNNTEDNIEFPLALSFPLPFRVLCLVGLGILGWATNLHGLDVIGIDVITTMDLWIDGRLPRSPLSAHRLHKHGLNTAALYRAIYRIFSAYSALCFISWITYRSMTHGDALLVNEFGYRYMPAIAALLVFLILICPFNILFKTERSKFLQSTGRCLFPSQDGTIYLSDVVFADIITSFAKVLGDVWLSMWMLLPGNSIVNPPAGKGWLQWVLPTIMSLPYLARLRQCLAEYRQGTSRRPLYNALKYATSFPVIYLSAAQRVVVMALNTGIEDQNDNEVRHGDHLFRLWLLAAAVNSIYSYWWDVTNDWGLDLLKPNPEGEPRERSLSPRHFVLPVLHSATPLLMKDSLDSLASSVDDSRPAIVLESPSRRRKTYPYGLRPTLLYPLPVYPLLLFLNLVLRLTWSIKLSSHLHLKTDGSVDIFWLEIAEVIRRWMWVFLRIEWEAIKRAPDGCISARTEELDDETGYEMIGATPDQDLFGLMT